MWTVIKLGLFFWALPYVLFGAFAVVYVAACLVGVVVSGLLGAVRLLL